MTQRVKKNKKQKTDIADYRTFRAGQHDLARVFGLIKHISPSRKVNCFNNDESHTLSP